MAECKLDREEQNLLKNAILTVFYKGNSSLRKMSIDVLYDLIFRKVLKQRNICDEVSDFSYKLLKNGNGSDDTLALAMRICIDLKNTKVLPLARILASDNQRLELQGQSIYALGELGDASDLYLLKKYSNDSAPNFYIPAEIALKRLRSRLSLK